MERATAAYRMQVAVERTKPNGRIIGIDLIPALPPKGVSTVQGNFLSKAVQDEVKRFLSDPSRGRPKQQQDSAPNDQSDEASSAVLEQKSYIDMERLSDMESAPATDDSLKSNGRQGSAERTVDIVLSDMSEPWPQTSGFWKRSLSNPYRMMNTSGILFRDHAGSMVGTIASFPALYLTVHRISATQPFDSHTRR